MLIRSMCGSPAVRIPGWLQNAASARAVRAQLGTEQGFGGCGVTPRHVEALPPVDGDANSPRCCFAYWKQWE